MSRRGSVPRSPPRAPRAGSRDQHPRRRGERSRVPGRAMAPHRRHDRRAKRVPLDLRPPRYPCPPRASASAHTHEVVLIERRHSPDAFGSTGCRRDFGEVARTVVGEDGPDPSVGRGNDVTSGLDGHDEPEGLTPGPSKRDRLTRGEVPFRGAGKKTECGAHRVRSLDGRLRPERLNPEKRERKSEEKDGTDRGARVGTKETPDREPTHRVRSTAEFATPTFHRIGAATAPEASSDHRSPPRTTRTLEGT
jgi:hypothetical protein